MKIFTIKSKLDDLIDEAIMELNDGYTDDGLVELMEDPSKRQAAAEYLIEKLEELV